MTDVEERVARWLWRREANEGQMVGNFKEQEKYYIKEAKKIIRMVNRK